MSTSLRYVCVAVALSTAACGSSNLTSPAELASTVVGTTGGTVATTDGALAVAIPAGALASNVTVTIESTTSPGSGALGKVFEIGPTGTQFTTPVTLTFNYGATSLAGTDPSMLRVATFASGSWQILAGAVVDTTAKTVSGTTMHLSPYGIVTASSGAICAAVSGGTVCSGSGVGGSDATSGSGALTSDTCTPSTCASATNACADFPGATLTGCTDSPTGYTASCCFATGADLCLSANGSGPACSGGSTATGSTTTTCTAAPTCASETTSTACGSLPGSTFQNCVDGANGYTASCCFAPTTPICTTVGEGVSCGGSTTGATSCGTAPSCADGDPCAGIAGTTMQSCTNNDNGYTAVCCLPVGVLPTVGGSSGTVVTGGSGTAGGSGSGSDGDSGSGTGVGGGAGGSTSTTGGGDATGGVSGGTGSGTGEGGQSTTGQGGAGGTG